MSLFRPTSDERPGDQSSETPSGKKIPMAMSMMVDSMVRMIQKAKSDQLEIEPDKRVNKDGENEWVKGYPITPNRLIGLYFQLISQFPKQKLFQ